MSRIVTMTPTEQDVTASRADDAAPDVSIVVPVLDERDALPELIDEIDAALAAGGRERELIFVDDGSTDGTGEYLRERAAGRDDMVVIDLGRNIGKSGALAAGFEASRGAAVVTLDGDGQDDPAEIPVLLAKLDEGYDLVSGWKRDRKDPLRRRLASRVFNRVTALISRVRLHDFNSGLKAYRGDRIRELRIYGEMHRYIPVLGAQQGWSVTEVQVNHRPREHGRTKFGFERYLRGMLDLLAVVFMGRYGNRPLHLFGGLGICFFVAGIGIEIYLTIVKLTGSAIGDRPLLVLGVLLIVVGIQLFTFGLLAQMIVAMRNERSRGRP
ncbi:MAG TPA: glycosyltransferase family 2 protein [Solirubrobacterales bacterium]|nr:glycosyltransferase family 2 protein [Solirubrobacterales bacterium]